jgi:hypothetical protein
MVGEKAKINGFDHYVMSLGFEELEINSVANESY